MNYQRGIPIGKFPLYSVLYGQDVQVKHFFIKNIWCQAFFDHLGYMEPVIDTLDNTAAAANFTGQVHFLMPNNNVPRYHKETGKQ